MKVALFVL